MGLASMCRSQMAMMLQWTSQATNFKAQQALLSNQVASYHTLHGSISDSCQHMLEHSKC